MIQNRDELKKKLNDKIKINKLGRSSKQDKEKYLDNNLTKMGIIDKEKFKEDLKKMNPDERMALMKAWNYWHPNTRDAIIFRRIDPNYDKKLKAKGIQIPPPDHSNTIVRGQAQKGSHRSRGEKRPVADRKRVTIEAMKKEKVLQSKKVTNITDMVLLKAIKNVDKSLKTQTSRIGTLKQTVKQQKSKKK